MLEVKDRADAAPVERDALAAEMGLDMRAWAGAGISAVGLSLSGCGGGGGDSSSPAVAPAATTATPDLVTPPPEPEVPPTAANASRFLAQASMGANRAEIERVMALGYGGWLDAQFDAPSSGTRWDWLLANGYADISFKNSEAGFDAVAWSKLLAAPDTLRQRITLALSEIFVIGIGGLNHAWHHFGAAGYLDLLEAAAFGDFRSLFQKISLNPAMGQFLTFRGNAKANATSGALPDENYAREVMQLFTIGLVQLNIDGTPKLDSGRTADTYSAADITGLARAFTGWDFDNAGRTGATTFDVPDYMRRPMVQVASRYETGEKSFLGTTIAGGTAAPQCLNLALDAIFAHANVAPFFCHQLIQRLVTSNPSPAYVGRIAAVFNNDGNHVRGNLRAVVRALLLDVEARTAPAAAALSYGKLREPMLRFAAWARAYAAASPSGLWAIGNTSDQGRALAQSPLRAASVFNFFRPGYLPPNNALGSASLLAPEFQITNESSVVAYLNFLQRAVAGTVGDITPDYTGLLALAATPRALVDEINLVLAANQLSEATAVLLATALQSMPSNTAAALRNRVLAALLLVLAAPEYIVQK